MPANLTPQYMEAERRFKQSADLSEKIAALEEMMAVIPKHKGTEKLQADLRRKMSTLRKETEQKKGAGGRRESFIVEREGARQLALVGAPNCGKSQLLRALTHATPEVADYPYTTRTPIPGMMIFENVRLQLVDLPAISDEYTEPWVPQCINRSDAILWVVDLSDDDILDRLDETERLLQGAKVAMDGRTLVVANKSDADGARDREEIVRDYVNGRFRITSISSLKGSAEELEQFKRRIFDFLNVVRVYTKAPGKKADFADPYVVPRGSTVLDVAEKVHRDFAEKLKYAKIWGDGKVDGIMVPRDFVINEGDILEFHD